MCKHCQNHNIAQHLCVLQLACISVLVLVRLNVSSRLALFVWCVVFQICLIGMWMWLGMDCGNRAGILQEHHGAGALEMEARLPPSLSASFPCTACAGSLLVVVRPGILLLEMCMEGCHINVTTRYTWTSWLVCVCNIYICRIHTTVFLVSLHGVHLYRQGVPNIASDICLLRVLLECCLMDGRQALFMSPGSVGNHTSFKHLAHSTLASCHIPAVW